MIITTSSKRKLFAGFVSVLTFCLFLVVYYLFSNGYGNYVTSSQFHTLILIDVLLFSLGVFSLVESKLTALLITIGTVFAFAIIVVCFLFFLFFAPELFPGSVNVKRLQTLEADAILNCPVVNSTFQQSEHSSLTEYAGHKNSFDGGETPTTMFRDINLNGADPKSVLATLAACAESNGWTMTPESTNASNFEQRGTKTYPDGWSASLYIEADMHPTVYRGSPTRQPNIGILIRTDFVP